jgi:hypothetical protein
MTPLRVAFDTGPLYGPTHRHRSSQCEAMHDALAARDDVALLDYLVSAGHVRRSARRLPLPARLAHRCWAHGQHPRVDRWLGDAQVVHGTNYVVPAQQAAASGVGVRLLVPALTPLGASPAVRRAGQVLRRAVATARWCTPAPSPRRAGARAVPHATVRTVHLGRARAACAPADCTVRAHAAAVRPRPRHARAPQEPAPIGAGVRRRSPRGMPDVQLVLAGGDGDDEAIRAPCGRRAGPAAGTGCAFTGRVDDAHPLMAAASRRGARVPVARRGVRLPAAGCDAGRRARGGQHRRVHPGGRRRGSIAQCTRRCGCTGVESGVGAHLAVGARPPGGHRRSAVAAVLVAAVR